MQMQVSGNDRNLGIELLRIVSMLMICMLHTLGQGGILESVPPFSKRYFFAWGLEILCYCSVNCFGLISGYVGLNSKSYFSRLVSLWLQTAFYTVLSACLFSLAAPEEVTAETWRTAFLPVMKRAYWYISAYFGLALLMPVFNAAVHKLERAVLRRCIIVSFAVMCVIPRFLRADPFLMNGGYSMVWLCMLYTTGGYIRKYDVGRGMRMRKPVIAFALSIAATCAAYFATAYIKTRFGYELWHDITLLSYVSPTIVAAGISLLLIFKGLEIKSGAAKKLITLFAPATLGVYLIHVNPLVWTVVLSDFALGFANNSAPVFAAEIFGAVFLLFVLCAVIDMGRSQLFELLRVKKLAKRIDERLCKII